MQWAVEQAWSYSPRRVWLHTCELDHPAAEPLYRKVGFQAYHEEMIDQAMPDGFPG